MQLFRFLRDLVRSFLRHGCASLAASLAFFSLLSLFPLVFLLLYGLSFVVSQDVIGEQVLLSFLKGFLPSMGEHVVKELHRVSALETVRWAVFLTFVWFGALVFYELDYALNVVFESTWRRHPLISTGIAVASLAVTELVLIALLRRDSNRQFPNGVCAKTLGARSPGPRSPRSVSHLYASLRAGLPRGHGALSARSTAAAAMA